MRPLKFFVRPLLFILGIFVFIFTAPLWPYAAAWGSGPWVGILLIVIVVSLLAITRRI